MKTNKISLLAVTILSLCSCSKEHIQRLPDYSRYNDQMDFYAYSAANDGTMTYDGTTTVIGESLLTVEQFKLYKEAGLNIFFPQSKAIIMEDQEANPTIRRDSWEKAKKVVDNAVEAGLDRTILLKICSKPATFSI